MTVEPFHYRSPVEGVESRNQVVLWCALHSDIDTGRQQEELVNSWVEQRNRHNSSSAEGLREEVIVREEVGSSK